MNSKIIKHIIFWLLLGMVFIMPFVRWEGVFFASIFSKSVLFYTVVEFILILWIPLIVLDKNYRPKLSRVFIALSAFLGIMFLSSIFGANFYKSLWSDYERMLGLWTYLHLFIFFLVLTSVLKEKKDWSLFLNVSLFSAALVGLYGWLEAFGVVGGFPDKIEGTIGNSIFLGSYLMFFAFLSLLLLFKQRNWNFQAIYYIFIFFVIAGAIVFTSARGSILALLTGLWALVLLFALFAPHDGQTLSIADKKLRKVAIILIVLAVVGAGLFFVFRSQFIDSSFGPLQRIASASFSEKTIQGRILTWGVAFEGWKEHFILGWGVENFNFLFNKHYNPRLYNQEPWFDRAHNFIFDIGATTGVLGLLSYLSVFGFSFWALFKRRKQFFWPFALLSSFFVAYLTNNFFAFDVLVSLIPLYIGLAYISFLETDPDDIIFRKIDFKKFSLLVVVVLLIILPIFYLANWKPLKENMLGRQGFARLVEGRDREAIELFEKGLEYDTFGNIDLRRFVAEYVFEFIQKGEGRSPQAMQGLLEYAAKKSEENIVERPKNVKWYMFSGELYSLLASYDSKYAEESEEKFLKAIELSSQRQQNYMEVGQAKIVKGDIEGAFEMINKAIDIFPQNPIVHIQAYSYAIKFDLREREKKEEKWVEENISSVDEEHLINIIETYFEVGRFEEAAEYQRLLIKFIEDRKGNPQGITQQYARLAAIYEQARQINKATETVLYIIEYNPEWAKENDAQVYLEYLKQLQ